MSSLQHTREVNHEKHGNVHTRPVGPGPEPGLADGFYEVGAPFRYETRAIPRFVLPGDEQDWIVIDHNTGSMWAMDGIREGCAWGQQTDWNSAIDWCENLVFAGYDDWRLPNVKELQSIVDYGRVSP